MLPVDKETQLMSQTSASAIPAPAASPGAPVIGGDALFNSRSEQLAVLTLRHAVPAIYMFREFVLSGGLAIWDPGITSPTERFGDKGLEVKLRCASQQSFRPKSEMGQGAAVRHRADVLPQHLGKQTLWRCG
jgi:hypothetical protein